MARRGHSPPALDLFDLHLQSAEYAGDLTVVDIEPEQMGDAALAQQDLGAGRQVLVDRVDNQRTGVAAADRQQQFRRALDGTGLAFRIHAALET